MKSGLETDKDHFQSAKMALQKATSKKKKSYFQEKVEKNAKELWKAHKSSGMKSGKVNQSKITLKEIFNLNLRKMQILLRICTLM